MSGETAFVNGPSQRLRELLPAVHSAGGVSPNRLRQEATWQSISLPRRTLNAGACQACKRRKCKCNGARPRCLACTQKGSECVYDDAPLTRMETETLKHEHKELRKQITTYGQVFKLLKKVSEDNAATILKRIREGEALETFLNSSEFAVDEP